MAMLWFYCHQCDEAGGLANLSPCYTHTRYMIGEWRGWSIVPIKFRSWSMATRGEVKASDLFSVRLRQHSSPFLSPSTVTPSSIDPSGRIEIKRMMNADKSLSLCSFRLRHVPRF